MSDWQLPITSASEVAAPAASDQHTAQQKFVSALIEYLKCGTANIDVLRAVAATITTLTATIATITTANVADLTVSSNVDAATFTRSSYNRTWCEYRNNDAAAINVPINFGTVTTDTQSLVTTGAGTWKFTVPVDGLYLVNCYLNVAAGHTIYLFVNGVSNRVVVLNSTAAPQFYSSVVMCGLAAGQYIDVRDNTGTGIAAATGRIQIAKIASI